MKRRNSMKKFFTLVFLTVFACSFNLSAQEDYLFFNGNLVNGEGQGLNGADLSIRKTALGLGTTGKGVKYSGGVLLADDFTVTGNAWQIDTIVFFVYETGGVIDSSSVVDLRFRIYDGAPDTNMTGGQVVYGDTAVNALTKTSWSGVYRLKDTDDPMTATTRPIMKVKAAVDVELAAGTYWVAWGVDVFDGGSVYQPLDAVGASVTTGNALRSSYDSWSPCTDNGVDKYQLDLPFGIIGSEVGNTGISNVNADLDVSIFPNPSTGQFTIKAQSDNHSIAQIEIIDVVGKVVLTKNTELSTGNNNILINASELNKGIYFVNTSINNKNNVTKIIVE